VTVRERGVMEKCTYCVQRIRNAGIERRVSGRPLDNVPLQTACQQACPARAITFGDLNDPASEVLRWRRDRRSYSVLHELGTRPRTQYLVRVKNPRKGVG
jgi:molybdopterin-containing oxidoreductase family iron-sulfur binding subunit